MLVYKPSQPKPTHYQWAGQGKRLAYRGKQLLGIILVGSSVIVPMERYNSMTNFNQPAIG